MYEVRYTTWQKEETLPQNFGKSVSVENINDTRNKIIIEDLVTSKPLFFVPKFVNNLMVIGIKTFYIPSHRLRKQADCNSCK